MPITYSPESPSNRELASLQPLTQPPVKSPLEMPRLYFMCRNDFFKVLQVKVNTKTVHRYDSLAIRVARFGTIVLVCQTIANFPTCVFPSTSLDRSVRCRRSILITSPRHDVS
jgi:hypothetical protein